MIVSSIPRLLAAGSEGSALQRGVLCRSLQAERDRLQAENEALQAEVDKLKADIDKFNMINGEACGPRYAVISISPRKQKRRSLGCKHDATPAPFTPSRSQPSC